MYHDDDMHFTGFLNTQEVLENVDCFTDLWNQHYLCQSGVLVLIFN